MDDFYAEGPSSFTVRGLWEGHCSPKCYYQMVSISNLQMTIKETDNSPSIDICFGKDNPYQRVVSYRPPHYINSSFEYEVFVNTDYVITVNDLSGKRRINSFIKTPYHGITEFHDKQTGLTWTQIIKQDEQSRGRR